MLVGSTALLVSLQLAAAATIPFHPSRAGLDKRATATVSEVTGNSAIKDPNYTTLTGLLPKVLELGVSMSTKSWELGTLTETLLEVYNPAFTPFEYDDQIFYASRNKKRAVNSGPSAWSAMKVGAEALAGYNWEGGPQGDSSKCSLYKYATEKATTPIVNGGAGQPLVNDGGSLADPASLGSIVWVLANVADGKHEIGAELKTSEQYAWAVGNQLAYLKSNTESQSFAAHIPHRTDGQKLWSDSGYMISPFIAFLGMTTLEETLLDIAISQWQMTSDALAANGLWKHFGDSPGDDLWSTGVGWMLLGLMRVTGSIQSSKMSGLDDKVKRAAGIAQTAFKTCFDNLKEGLLTNKITLKDEPETAGTAAVVAAYYRFKVLFPDLATGMEDKAAEAFGAVVSKIDTGSGKVLRAVDPSGANNFNVPPPGEDADSPEAQCFVAQMWAARTAAGV